MGLSNSSLSSWSLPKLMSSQWSELQCQNVRQSHRQLMRHRTNEIVDEYEMAWPCQEDYQLYLDTLLRRIKQNNIVEFKQQWDWVGKGREIRLSQLSQLQIQYKISVFNNNCQKVIYLFTVTRIIFKITLNLFLQYLIQFIITILDKYKLYRYIRQQHLSYFCSTVYHSFVYFEGIKARLSQLTTVPCPDNLYLLLATLQGYDHLQKEFKNFQLTKEHICITFQGQVKVWINSRINRSQMEAEENKSSEQQFTWNESVKRNSIRRPKNSYNNTFHKIQASQLMQQNTSSPLKLRNQNRLRRMVQQLSRMKIDMKEQQSVCHILNMLLDCTQKQTQPYPLQQCIYGLQSTRSFSSNRVLDCISKIGSQNIKLMQSQDGKCMKQQLQFSNMQSKGRMEVVFKGLIKGDYQKIQN